MRVGGSAVTTRAWVRCFTLLFALWMFAPAPDAWAKKRRRKRPSPRGPTLVYEQFRKKIALKVAQKREEQIKGIKKLISLGPEEREVPDLKYRLAELYYEKSRAYFFQAEEAEGQRIEATSKKEKATFRRKSKKSRKASKSWLEQAMRLYQSIREDYPKYQRMPEVLFALGQAFWNENRFGAAIKVYVDLIKSYPESPQVSEAYIAFGEYYFNEGRVKDALQSYKKAAANKRSRVYGFALYKQAWCYYNLSEWKKALRKFEAAVYYADLAQELSGENRIALGREAQKDYVRTYSHIGTSRRARYQIGSLLGDDDCKKERCQKLVEQLARLWFDEGNFEDSASVYRQIIRLNPNSSRNPLFQARIVDVASRSGDRKRVIREIDHLVQLYEKAKALVSDKGLGQKELKTAKENLSEAKELAESTVRKLAQVWNRDARKLRSQPLYKDAKALYRTYLRLFPKAEPAYEMRFQLADLYYKLEMFDDAAKTYKATVLSDSKGKYLVSAANDNILALDEHIKDLRVKAPKHSESAVKIHPQVQRLLEACERYIELVPKKKAKKLVFVRFKAAKIYYDYSHYDEAVKRFDKIVKGYPESKQAEVAANLVLDVFNIQEDWPKLYEYSTGYQRIEALVSDRAKLSRHLSEASEYAKFSMVQILEKEAKENGETLAKVATAYEEFYQEFPSSPNADKALYNASVVWDRQGDRARADALRQKLLSDFKDSPLGADVRYHVAKSHEEKTEYARAAKAFLSFAQKHPKDARAADALYNAAVLFAGVGSVNTANKVRRNYLKNYSKTKGSGGEAASINFAMARDLESAGKYRAAARAYADFSAKFTNAPQLFEAWWREAELRRRLGHRTKAEKIEKTLLGTYWHRRKRNKKLPQDAAYYASQVGFRSVDKDFRAYKRLRIRTPSTRNPRPFQQSLEEKARARSVLVRRYTKVVKDYGQAESTIASLYRIAEAWDVFVGSLVRVPCPRGVSSEVCTYIKGGMEEKAAPAREAAYAGYKACVEKSNELNTFTSYSSLCVKALGALAPDAHPPIVEFQAEYEAPSQIETLEANPLILDHQGDRAFMQARGMAGQAKQAGKGGPAR